MVNEAAEAAAAARACRELERERGGALAVLALG